MRGVDVTLRGEWSRTNTTRSEAYAYRQILRRSARLEFQLPQSERDEKCLHGTFEVTIPLGLSPWLSTRKLQRVALLVLKAQLAKALCRPPNLKNVQVVGKKSVLVDGPYGTQI